MSYVKGKRLIGFGISVANLRQAMESGVPVVFEGVDIPEGARLHDVRYNAPFGGVLFVYEVDDPGIYGYDSFDHVPFRRVTLEPLVKEDAD